MSSDRAPNVRLSAVGGAGLIACLLLLTGVAPSMPHSVPAAPGPHDRVGGSESMRTPASSVHPPSSPDLGSNVSLGGRLFHTQVLGPTGLVSPATAIAVDGVSQTAFTISRTALSVTSFSARDGTFITRVSAGLPATDPWSGGPTGVVFDPAHDRVDVIVQSPGSQGEVLVLGAPLLQTLATIPLGPGFQPTRELYDPASTELIVENATGSVVVVNTTRDIGVANLAIPCSPQVCSAFPMFAAPAHHLVVCPEADNLTFAVNTSSNTVQAVPLAFSNLRVIAGTYDVVSDTFWLSYPLSNRIGIFQATSGTWIRNLTLGPATPLALLADPKSGLVIVSTNNTTAGANEQLMYFAASNGSFAGEYHNAYAWTGQVYASLALEAMYNVDLLLTAGSANDTCAEFGLLSTAPHVTLIRTFPSIVGEQLSVRAAPSLGLYFLLSRTPDGVLAVNDSTNAPVWFRTPGGPYPFGQIAVDEPHAVVYATESVNHSLLAFAALSGAWLSSTPLAGNPAMVAVDPSAQRVYVEEPSGGPDDAVEVLTTAGSAPSSLGLVHLAGTAGCALIPDSARGRAYLADCGGSGRVWSISGQSLSASVPFPSGLHPADIAIGPGNDLYVANPLGLNVTVLDPVTNRSVGAIPTGTTPVYGLSYAPTLGWLFAAGRTSPSLLALDALNRSILGSLAAPSVCLSTAWDWATQTLVAPTWVTGEVFLAGLVSRPTTPVGLHAVPMNRSVVLGWNASIAPAGFPVVYMINWTGPNGTGGGSASTGNLSESISGLTNGVRYDLAVRAINSAGGSTWAPSVVATPGSIPYPPANVTAAGAGTGAVDVRWNAPGSTDGSPVSNYTVWFRNSTAPWQSLRVSNQSTERLAGLTPGVSYSIYVTATNAFGPSHPSAVVVLAVPTPSTPPGPAGTAWILPLEAIGAFVVVGGAIVLLLQWRARRRAGADQTAAETPEGAAAEAGESAEPPEGR